MIVPLLIEIVLLFVGVYYLTVIAHLFGLSIFSKKDWEVSKSMIPFYCWINDEKTVVIPKEDLSLEEEIAVAEEALRRIEERLKILEASADKHSIEAIVEIERAKKAKQFAKNNLQRLIKNK